MKGTAWRVYKFGGASLGVPGRLEGMLRLVGSALAAGGRLAVVAASAVDDAPVEPRDAAEMHRLALDAAARAADALRAAGTPARAVDARDFLVAEASDGAAIDWKETRLLFARAREAWGSEVPVVAGGIARARDGRSLSLGQNGSDYTAAILGALLGAASVTIWTESLGVMTADPAIVPEALAVTHLSYGEALELAYFGTRMLHPRTIAPVSESGAVLCIRNAGDPDAPGTTIGSGDSDPNRPTCVTSLEGLSLIAVNSRRAEAGRPVGGRIVSALGAAGVRVWLAAESTLGQTFSAVVSRTDESRGLRLIEKELAAELHNGDFTLAPARGPLTMVTLVAEAMGRSPNVAGRFFGALGRPGVAVHAIGQSAAQRSISGVVDAADTAVAVRAVHSAFNLSHAEVSVFLLGKGLVGRSLLAQMAEQAASLRGNHDVHLKLVGLADSRRAVIDSRGIDPAGAAARLAAAGASHSGGAAALLGELARLPNPIMVDCTAADGMERLYAQAFAAGINVVSANKKPLALSQAEADALKAAARRHYRGYRYETTVGAALPVIETLKDLVRTGDKVVRVEGAFSGTLGFVCERLAAGEALSAAVARARDLGYTEPNPRDDLSGLDVARKALILARELGLRLDPGDVDLKPFVPAQHLKEDDAEAFLASLRSLDAVFAARVGELAGRGCTLRYLARIEPGAGGSRVSVAPVEVAASHPAASLNGAEAFVAFYTARYRDHPLIVRGAGAGGDVTAAGVLADILRLAQNVSKG